LANIEIFAADVGASGGGDGVEVAGSFRGEGYPVRDRNFG